MHHDPPAYGHPGISKTLELTAQRYWWPHMAQDVKDYVKGCADCHCMSQYNGSWLDSTWVVLGLSSRRKASYCSFCSLSDLARLERWSVSLAQTIFCCSSLPWWGDKNSGYEEGQWGPIVVNDESESWSNSKGTQLRGIGRSERDVVVLQEIEPKVRFLILQSLYTVMRWL